MRRGLEVVNYPLRVLLVDDDDAIAMLLEVTFAGDPRFELVARARDGAEGVRLVQALRPDVILMDIHMPVLDGIAATTAIVEAEPAACVICFTSSSDAHDHAAAREAGASAILAKPFNPEALIDAVAAHAARCARNAA